MDNVIQFTPSQIVAILGAIITLNGAIMVFINWRDKLKAPEDLQNNRITELERKVSELEKGRQMNEASIIQLEQSTLEFQKIMVKSLQALSEHALDSSEENKRNLKDSVAALNGYLIDGIKK